MWVKWGEMQHADHGPETGHEESTHTKEGKRVMAVRAESRGQKEGGPRPSHAIEFEGLHC